MAETILDDHAQRRQRRLDATAMVALLHAVAHHTACGMGDRMDVVKTAEAFRAFLLSAPAVRRRRTAPAVAGHAPPVGGA